MAAAAAVAADAMRDLRPGTGAIGLGTLAPGIVGTVAPEDVARTAGRRTKTGGARDQTEWDETETARGRREAGAVIRDTECK